MASSRSIGVISDTHGLLRPQALAALRGCEMILHAGDVGSAEVLAGLQEIAPLIAVRGNVDTGAWARSLPTTEVVEVGRVTLYLLHNIAELDIKPEAAGFRAVIYGHSHKLDCREKNGVLYLNPGSAGPRRFRLPVSVARLTISGDQLRWAVVELDPQRPGT